MRANYCNMISLSTSILKYFLSIVVSIDLRDYIVLRLKYNVSILISDKSSLNKHFYYSVWLNYLA